MPTNRKDNNKILDKSCKSEKTHKYKYIAQEWKRIEMRLSCVVLNLYIMRERSVANSKIPMFKLKYIKLV